MGEGLEEFFQKNKKSVYTKREIFEFLKKTFVFCSEFDLDSLDNRIDNNYLWILLDYYATLKKLTMTFDLHKGEIKFEAQIMKLRQS